jgi:hypothetical protein
MKAKGFAGSLAGIPARGGVISIDNADAVTIIDATSGLIKTVAGVALSAGKGILIGGLAIGLLSFILNDLLTKPSPKVPIFSLARIRIFGRKFLGICTTEFFECVCGRERLKIPTHVINSIEDSCHGGVVNLILDGYNIELIDGSKYSNCMPITSQLLFLTLAGEQKIVIFRTERVGFFKKQHWTPYRPKDSEVGVDIEGVTVEDVDDLRQRLVFAYDNNAESIIETIGRDRFEKYLAIRD